MPPAIIAAAITVGGSLASGALNNAAIGKATDAQNSANQQAIALQQQNRSEDIARQAPWLDFGKSALGELGKYYGFNAGSPGGSGGGVDWNAYIAQNPDVADIQAVMSGQKQGTQDQQNFIADFQRSGMSNLGEYHHSVVGDRALPMMADGPAAAPSQMPALPSTVPAWDPSTVVDPRSSGFQASPDYAFRQAEGARAVTASKAARGLLESGSYGTALAKTGQDLASGEYQNWWDRGRQDYADKINTAFQANQTAYTRTTSAFDTWYNRLASAAGIGQSVASDLGRSGQTTADNVGGILQNIGQTTAQGAIQQAANTGKTISDIAGIGSGVLQNRAPAGGTFLPSNWGTAGAPVSAADGASGMWGRTPAVSGLFGSPL